MKSYKELKVWQKSIEPIPEIYIMTKIFPKEEKYGLTSQIRRSAVSLPSNIAEGYSRLSTKEFIQFLKIAFASGAELETQLIISYKLELISEDDLNKVTVKLEEIQKMLNALISSLKKKL